MKIFILILSLLSIFLFVFNIYADVITVKKVYLKYQDGTEKTYDLSTPYPTITADEVGCTSGPTGVCTLTDTTNNLPTGVIIQIKYYGEYSFDPGNNWWVTNTLGSGATVADGFNFLGANVDLSSIKRKKVTTRVRGDGVDLHTLTPSEENL